MNIYLFLCLKKIGLALFLLYIFQALYGLIIHFVKSPNRKKRPIQNYGHAVVGLGLIALALYQVWDGFSNEWSKATGRDTSKRGLKIFWIIWIVVRTARLDSANLLKAVLYLQAIGGAYVVGLALLPKQYRAEDQAARNREKALGAGSSQDDVHPMTDRRA
jgi:hypothetical protein